MLGAKESKLAKTETEHCVFLPNMLNIEWLNMTYECMNV